MTLPTAAPCPSGGRKLASPDQLPEVTVLIVRRVDRDGTLLAVPALEVDGAPPSIRVFPDKRGGRARGRAAGSGASAPDQRRAL